jgi:MFS-type transporter involved in bile tolerance (Atg22 family)
MRGKSSLIALIAICFILISLTPTIGENISDFKKISEDHRYDSFGFAIFLAGSFRLASSVGRLCLLKTSKSQKPGKE